MFNKYPYSDFHELNADWLLSEVKPLPEKFHQLEQHVDEKFNELEQDIADIDQELDTKVDKVPGMGLSENSFTTAEQTKLAGIEAGAQVNVQADWDENDTSSNAYIQNKPYVPAPIIETASGSIATFTDGANAPAIGLTADINAVQSGSGDPSPVNVRPISGYSAVNVVVSPTLDAQDGTTTTINLGSTYYGGTLDVTSGVLTVTHGIVDLGSLEWAYNGSAFSSMREFSVVLTGKANGILNMMCSALTVKSASGASGYQCIRGRAANATISVVWDDMTPANFKTAVSGYQLVYELATPATVTLTPAQVDVLLGTNNIWADSGNVSVTYIADTKLNIEKTSWNFLGTCASGTTVTLTLPDNWTGIIRIWYPYQTTALRYYEIYAICDSNGNVYQFAVSNTTIITLTQAQNTITLAISSTSPSFTCYFTYEGSGKITAAGLD